MEYFVGIDVSLNTSAVCVMDAHGQVVKESQVASEPEAVIAHLREIVQPVACVGLEAGPLSQWLHQHLEEAGIVVALMETRHVKGALKAMPIKTDRRDALGIAHLLRMGWYRPVHCKSVSAQETRAVLAGRKAVKTAMLDLENAMRGVLRNFGLKVGPIAKGRFETRVRELTAGNGMLELTVEGMLRARRALRTELAEFDRRLRELARDDEVCRRMMTVPGVGALVALTVKSGIDDPSRFRSSRSVGAHFGLTPSRQQSGEKDVVGSITRAGDVRVRTALYEAATTMMHRSRKPSWLKAWGLRVAARRGMKRAVVAVARRLAVVLHRMWLDGSEFRFAQKTADMAA